MIQLCRKLSSIQAKIKARPDSLLLCLFFKKKFGGHICTQPYNLISFSSLIIKQKCKTLENKWRAARLPSDCPITDDSANNSVAVVELLPAWPWMQLSVSPVPPYQGSARTSPARSSPWTPAEESKLQFTKKKKPEVMMVLSVQQSLRSRRIQSPN